MRTIAIANQKGGVGKTTTAVNLATALAACGRRVLLLDFDPQGNASTALGLGRDDREPSAYAILLDPDQVHAAVRETEIPGLFLLPADQELAGAEVELVGAENPAGRLKDAIKLLKDLDYIFIDCPPSLSLLTLNGLVAADRVLVPLQAEYLAMEGLQQLMRTVEQVRRRQNRTLDYEGVVLTMVDRRNNLSREVEDSVRAALGDRVFRTTIPRNVRLSEAPSHGRPALVYDPACPGSLAYAALAAEILGAATVQQRGI